jgi:hypothetical protein
MRDQMGRNNILQRRLDNGSLSSSSRWQRIEDSNFDFPRMSLNEIRELVFGTYQIKTGRCYVEEHMNSDGDYVVQVDNSNDNIVRASIQSRHSNASVIKPGFNSLLPVIRSKHGIANVLPEHAIWGAAVMWLVLLGISLLPATTISNHLQIDKGYYKLYQ